MNTHITLSQAEMTTHPSEMLTRLDQLTSAMILMARNKGERLTRTEFAARLRIHPRTLAERIKAGSVPGPKDGMWYLADVINWEHKQ